MRSATTTRPSIGSATASSSAAQDSDGVIEAVEIPGRELRFGGAVASRGAAGRPPAVRRLGAGRDGLCNRKGECVTSSVLINPATEKELRRSSRPTVEGVDDAVARAKAAQRDWAEAGPGRPGRQRCGRSPPSSMRTWTSLPRSRSPTPAIRSATREWEAGHVRDVLQFYSASPERLSGKQIPVAGGLDVTFNEPLGVIGVITPWNFPMTIAAWGFAPALAAGNAVRREAGGMDTADHHPSRRARGRSRPARRSVPSAARQGLGGGGAIRHPSRRPQDRVHRLDRGRHAR